MKTKLLALLFVIFLTFIKAYSQEVINEKGLTSTYFNDRIQLSFDSKKIDLNQIKAVDAFTTQSVTISNKDNTTELQNLRPGQIIKLSYLDDNEYKTTYLASKSLSTGTINVYFNHLVNISVATPGNNAIDLGNTVDDKLIATINACTATLDIAIYSCSSPSATTGIAGAINDAYSRGVQVRIIYDSTTTSNMIGFLNPSIPLLAAPTGTSYGIMHNKFVIMDANSSDATKPLVWTGSTNWTVSQIDGPDKNNVITIQDQSLALGYELEFEEMWGSATTTPNLTNSKFGQFKLDNTPHNYIIGGKVVESYFSPSDGTNEKIINTINTANADINIATMLITRSDIANAISAKYSSGIANTNLVVDTQNPSGNQFNTVQASIAPNHAVKDVLTGIMHHKFMVIDNSNPASDPLVWTGSHNWSSSAETRNDENSLVVHDANIANQYYQAFYYLYTLSSGVLNIMDTEFENASLVIYPNPVNEKLYVNNVSSKAFENVVITITDLVGKKVFEEKVDNLISDEINFEDKAKGIYILNIKTAKFDKTYKLLVE